LTSNDGFIDDDLGIGNNSMSTPKIERSLALYSALDLSSLFGRGLSSFVNRKILLLKDYFSTDLNS
jgi:hypothetical protein